MISFGVDVQECLCVHYNFTLLNWAGNSVNTWESMVGGTESISSDKLDQVEQNYLEASQSVEFAIAAGD